MSVDKEKKQLTDSYDMKGLQDTSKELNTGTLQKESNSLKDHAQGQEGQEKQTDTDDEDNILSSNKKD